MDTIRELRTPPGIRYGFGDNSESWAENAIWTLDDTTVEARQVVSVEQTHSADVLAVDERHRGMRFPHADGLVTAATGVFLLVRAADCLPLLLCDPVRGVVGAVHSGREGTRKNIAAACVNVMRENFDSNSADILAMLGAAIAVESYEVGEDVYAEFQQTALAQHPHRRIDVRAEIVAQLVAEGLQLSNIGHLNRNTYADMRYYSWRRDKATGRHVGVIGKISVDENHADR